MNKFTKAILLISLLLFLVGGGCLIAGCVMGITSGDLIRAFEQIPFIDFENHIIITEDQMIQIPSKDETDKEDVISSAWDFQKEEVQNLNLELANVNCTIYPSEEEQILVMSSNANHTNVDLKNGTLKIENNSKVLEKDGFKIEIYLPKDWKLEEFDLQAGAGNVLIESPIQADVFKIEAGASVVKIEEIVSANEFDVEVGAGMVFVKQVDAMNIRLENGVGKTTLGLYGQKENYHVTIESAAGNVQYGDEAFSGIANTYRDQPKDAVRYIEIESALGEVIITFEEVI